MTANRHSAQGLHQDRSNVVLIVVDEWRAQAFGSMGDTNAHTPALDRLAAESIVFDQAVSGHPVCCPARASFMTGQYPLRHGVYVNDVRLETKDTTLAQAFSGAGYSTAYIGKWHLYGSPEGRFERREQFVPKDARLGFEYWKAGECTHDYNHSAYFDHEDTSVRYWPGYDAFAQTEDAVELLKNQEQESDPLFLMLSFGPPHFPLHSAPNRFQEMYDSRDIALRANVPESCEEQGVTDLRGYYAHIAAIDECVGRVLDAVADSNTVVVFTSDHGDMLWSQGLEYKLTPWEESIRVPLFVRIPGRKPEHRQAHFNSPDLMPTLLGLAGIDVPSTVDGQDLLASDGPTSAFLNVPVAFSSLRRCGIEEYRGVRTSRHTYAVTTTGPWLLYDNLEDPFQLANRIDDPEYAAIQEQLDGELRGWLQRLGDDFLDGADYIRQLDLDHYFEVNEPLGFCQGANGDWRSTNARGRLWSIDTPIASILGNPASRRLVEQLTPTLVEANPAWNLRHSLRLAAMADRTSVNPDDLLRLDEALNALTPRDAEDRNAVSPAALPPHGRLHPNGVNGTNVLLDSRR